MKTRETCLKNSSRFVKIKSTNFLCVGKAEALPNADDSFDCVYCSILMQGSFFRLKQNYRQDVEGRPLRWPHLCDIINKNDEDVQKLYKKILEDLSLEDNASRDSVYQ